MGGVFHDAGIPQLGDQTGRGRVGPAARCDRRAAGRHRAERLAIVARHSPAERPRAFGLIAVLLSQLGVAAAVGVSRLGVVVALLAAITLLRLAIVARHSPAERPRAFGLIAVLLSQLGVAAAVGVSRSGFGPGAAVSSRYISISAPLLSVFYFAWLLYGPNPCDERSISACLHWSARGSRPMPGTPYAWARIVATCTFKSSVASEPAYPRPS